MSVKQHLKTICNYEKEVYERTARVQKTELVLNEVKEKIDNKKKKLNENLSKLRREYTRNKDSEQAYLKPVKENFNRCVRICIWLAIGTIVFHLLLLLFVSVIIRPSEVWQVAIILAIANIGPAVVMDYVINEVTYDYEYIKWFFASEAILTIVAGIYLAIYTANGATLGAAIIAAMVFFLILEIVISPIVCLCIRNGDKRIAKSNAYCAKRYKKDANESLTKANAQKKDIEAFDAYAKNIITLMEADFTKEKQLLKVAEENLARTYAEGILHPNYRNWVAAATIYEYLDVGRCYELKGPHGAYNLYEQELIARKILDSLEQIRSEISYQGHRISNTQHFIKAQLLEVSNKIDRMSIETYGWDRS